MHIAHCTTLHLYGPIRSSATIPLARAESCVVNGLCWPLGLGLSSSWIQHSAVRLFEFESGFPPMWLSPPNTQAFDKLKLTRAFSAATLPQPHSVNVCSPAPQLALFVNFWDLCRYVGFKLSSSWIYISRTVLHLSAPVRSSATLLQLVLNRWSHMGLRRPVGSLLSSSCSVDIAPLHWPRLLCMRSGVRVRHHPAARASQCPTRPVQGLWDPG